MVKKEIKTKNAPEAVGPYSQGIRVNNMLFTSGQIPIDKKTGKIIDGGIDEQAKQTFNNLEAILEAGGSSFSDVLKTTIYLKDLGDFAKVNEIYAAYFKEPYPARSCIEVSALPKGALIEVDAIAVVKE